MCTALGSCILAQCRVSPSAYFPLYCFSCTVQVNNFMALIIVKARNIWEVSAPPQWVVVLEISCICASTRCACCTDSSPQNMSLKPVLLRGSYDWSQGLWYLRLYYSCVVALQLCFRQLSQPLRKRGRGLEWRLRNSKSCAPEDCFYIFYEVVKLSSLPHWSYVWTFPMRLILFCLVICMADLSWRTCWVCLPASGGVCVQTKCVKKGSGLSDSGSYVDRLLSKLKTSIRFSLKFYFHCTTELYRSVGSFAVEDKLMLLWEFNYRMLAAKQNWRQFELAVPCQVLNAWYSMFAFKQLLKYFLESVLNFWLDHSLQCVLKCALECIADWILEQLSIWRLNGVLLVQFRAWMGIIWILSCLAILCLNAYSEDFLFLECLDGLFLGWISIRRINILIKPNWWRMAWYKMSKKGSDE